MKKILIVLLSLFLFTGCAGGKNGGEDSSKQDGSTEYSKEYCIEALKNYEGREKNKNNTTDNAEFNAFLDDATAEFLGMDYLNMHFTVIDYKKYGVEKPEVTFGIPEYGYDEETYEQHVRLLNELAEFDFDSLSYEQQINYEALEYSLYEDLCLNYFYQYSFMVSSDSCVPESMYSNLTDFTFYDEESVDDYIELMESYADTLDGIYEYTKAQAADGYGPIDEWLDYTMDAIDGILNRTEDNDLIVTFDERIDALDFLSDEKKEEVKARNKELVLNEVLPAYEQLNEDLEEFYGKVDSENYALCNLDEDYASVEFIINTSCNDTAEEMLEVLTAAVNYYENQYLTVTSDDDLYDETIDFLYNPPECVELTGVECLEYLRQNMGEYYPVLEDVEYSAEMLNADTATASVIGYYYSSPLDNANQNIIRLNPNNLEAGLATYTTLSHEGFPGHLYQHVYYLNTDPHPIRSTIGFTGYNEGFAVMASNDAAKYIGLSDEVADTVWYIGDNNGTGEYYFYVYSVMDVLTNLMGYDAEEIKEYFNDNFLLGYVDDQYWDYFRDFMIEMPCVYSRYAVGASKLLQYRLDAEEALGDKFDMVSFNELIMENGPLPYGILGSLVEDCIEENQ